MVDDDRYRAKIYVEKYFQEMKEKLEIDGYFVYDEYETIYIHTGRFIPEILNEKLFFSEDETVHAVEEMIKGEGNCGIIVKANMLDDRQWIIDILKRFYER